MKIKIECYIFLKLSIKTMNILSTGILIILCLGFYIPLHNSEYNIKLAVQTGSLWLSPMYIWPFVLFCIILTATIDWPYFPTSGCVASYILAMLYFKHIDITVITELNTYMKIGIVLIYFGIGFLWLRGKWWSILRENHIQYIIKNIKEGEETKFFVDQVPKLYPHFLYWPLSMPSTFINNFAYQMFESLMKRFGGAFGKMVVNRRNELNNIN